MVLNSYVVLDIETTGLSRFKHEITEIAAVKVKNGVIIDKYQSLVNPQVPIPSFITRLTGISNEMVKDSDPIYKILPSFVNFLGDSVIIAHNATFDYGFLNHNMEKHFRTSLPNQKLCTKKLASRLLPSLPSKRLSSICEFLDIQNERAHRAMADTLATEKVFSVFMQMAKDKGISSEEEFFKFESMPMKKIVEIKH